MIDKQKYDFFTNLIRRLNDLDDLNDLCELVSILIEAKRNKDQEEIDSCLEAFGEIITSNFFEMEILELDDFLSPHVETEEDKKQRQWSDEVISAIRKLEIKDLQDLSRAFDGLNKAVQREEIENRKLHANKIVDILSK